MTNVAELIERLLSFKPFLEAHHCSTAAIDEAASTIESLSERIAVLEGALEAIDKTTFIGVTTDSEQARRVALESAHDIATSSLASEAPQ